MGMHPPLYYSMSGRKFTRQKKKRRQHRKKEGKRDYGFRWREKKAARWCVPRLHVFYSAEAKQSMR
jgi:hypothetical protein